MLTTKSYAQNNNIIVLPIWHAKNWFCQTESQLATEYHALIIGKGKCGYLTMKFLPPNLNMFDAWETSPSGYLYATIS